MSADIPVFNIQLERGSTPSTMSACSCKGVGFIPITLGIVMSAGCIITYIIAVANHDVTPYVPFISEAGAKPPEGGIFSIFLYLSSTVGIVTVILRFMIISEFNQSVDRCLDRANAASISVGIVSMLGMIVVAAYPMTTIMVAHAIGANAAFMGCVIYGSCQTWISYRMNPYYNGLTICRTRLTLTILSAFALLIMLIFGPIAQYLWKSASHNHWTGSKNPKDKGFDMLIVSSAAEWTMAFLFVLYFFSFIREFQKISVHINIQLLVNHMEESLPDTQRTGPSERSTLL